MRASRRIEDVLGGCGARVVLSTSGATLSCVWSQPDVSQQASVARIQAECVNPRQPQDLNRGRERLFQRHSADCQPRGKRVALELLHDEEVHLLMTANVVESADVGVGEGGYRPRFPSEPRAHLRIECYAGRQDFDRHEAIQAGVCGAENLSHAAGAEAAFDPVRAQEVTGTKIETSTEHGRRGRPPD